MKLFLVSFVEDGICEFGFRAKVELTHEEFEKLLDGPGADMDIFEAKHGDLGIGLWQANFEDWAEDLERDGRACCADGEFLGGVSTRSYQDARQAIVDRLTKDIENALVSFDDEDAEPDVE